MKKPQRRHFRTNKWGKTFSAGKGGDERKKLLAEGLPHSSWKWPNGTARPRIAPDVVAKFAAAKKKGQSPIRSLKANLNIGVKPKGDGVPRYWKRG